MARSGSLTAFELAEVWPRAVAMRAVSFSLVAQQTGVGGEGDVDARLLPALERLEVRVNVSVVAALALGRFVVASGLALFGAVVVPISVCGSLVEGMAADRTGRCPSWNVHVSICVCVSVYVPLCAPVCVCIVACARMGEIRSRVPERLDRR